MELSRIVRVFWDKYGWRDTHNGPQFSSATGKDTFWCYLLSLYGFGFSEETLSSIK